MRNPPSRTPGQGAAPGGPLGIIDADPAVPPEGAWFGLRARARRDAARPADLDGLAVLVLATGYRAGPWACRSLTEAGCRVVGAHREGRLQGGRSRWCRSPLRYPSAVHDPDGFVAWVVDTCRSEAIDVVLPVGEDEARVMAERQPDIRPAVCVGPDADQYRRLCDKEELGATAAAAGVDHPESVLVTPSGPQGAYPPLPSVVKPRISGEDLDDSEAVVRVETEAARDAAVAALVDSGRDALVQRFVDGTAYVARCVSAPGVFEISAFRVDRQHPRAAGTPSVQTTVTASPELTAVCRRLFAEVGYTGAGSVCVIEADGRLWLHDVNLRMSGTLGAVIRSGLDVPRRVVEIASGRRVQAPPPVRGRTTTYVRTDGEWAALTESLRGRSGERPGPIAATLLRGALRRDHILDPSPADPYWLPWVAAVTAYRGLRGARRRLPGR